MDITTDEESAKQEFSEVETNNPNCGVLVPEDGNKKCKKEKCKEERRKRRKAERRVAALLKRSNKTRQRIYRYKQKNDKNADIIKKQAITIEALVKAVTEKETGVKHGGKGKKAAK